MMRNSLEAIALISGGLVGFFVGLFLIAAVGAMALRLATLILNYGRLSFISAFKATLLASFVTLVTQSAVGFQVGWLHNMSRKNAMNMGYSPMYEMSFSFTPTMEPLVPK